jgi:hypothetical protein
LEFGQLVDIGILIQGTERLLLAIDRAYRKACATETNIGYCEEFLTNGRRMIREELNAENFDVGFQVDEFQALDHHGNLGYKLIGNFSSDFKYIEVEDYRVFAAGVSKYETQHISTCSSPLCVCKQQKALKAGLNSASTGLGGKYGPVKWYQADVSSLKLQFNQLFLEDHLAA